MNIKLWGKTFFSLVMVMTVISIGLGCGISNRQLAPLRNDLQFQKSVIVELQETLKKDKREIEELNNHVLMLKGKLEENTQFIQGLEAKVGSLEDLQKVKITEKEMAIATEEIIQPLEEPYSLNVEVGNFLSAEQLYGSAYDHLNSGDLGQAILEFEEYVANYQETDLSDNAQYWIGECYYTQNDYQQAIKEFQKVINNFSSGNKVPAAMLKIGYSYYELGDTAKALEKLRKVVNQFPNSEEAKLAVDKISEWQ